MRPVDVDGSSGSLQPLLHIVDQVLDRSCFALGQLVASEGPDLLQGVEEVAPRVAGCSAFRGSSGGGPPIAVTYRPVCYKRPTRLVKTEAAAAELMAALAAEAAEEGG